jgi:osmotically inducible lipoprotein OsmB
MMEAGMRKSVGLALVLMLGVSSLSGCLATHTQRSTAVGGIAGAAVGGLVTGSAGGAVVGGLLGAGTGYVIANNSHPCWKHNIFTGQRYRGWCLNG